MSLFAPTHADLCAVAVKWLYRNRSQGGHGCHVAVSECRGGWVGEVPDAIGFRAAGGHDDGSIVVECKTSRSDFLADRAKPHRQSGGMGNWRYFMAPEGTIKPEEVPQGWGLLTVNSRLHVKPVLGPAAAFRQGYDVVESSLDEFRHEANQSRERFLLTKLLARVGDPEKVNQTIKVAYADQRRLAARCDELSDQLRRERMSRFERKALQIQTEQEQLA